MATKKSTTPGNKLAPADLDRAQRCKRLRLMLHYEQSAAFAAALKVSPQRWNHVENGRPLGHELAIRLVNMVPGLTLDWLYFGKPDGLPLDLARRLGEVPAPGKRKTVS